MARELQAQLEHEADHKKLHGEARADYIGGAWNRIKNHNRKGPWWLVVEDKERLEKVTGPIDKVIYHKDRNSVVIQQGDSHYELPEDEYFALVRAGKEMEEEEKREARRQRRALREEERDRIRQERMVRTVERIEYHDVAHIIKRAGGIRAVKDMHGQVRDREELKIIPKSLRAKQTREVRALGQHGLTLDEAATAVHQHMPWLQIDTPDDLVQYFERHEDRRYYMVELTKAQQARVRAERAEADRVKAYHADREAKKAAAAAG